jgi:hypothetical protein
MKEAQAGEQDDDSGEEAAIAIPTVYEKGTAGERADGSGEAVAVAIPSDLDRCGGANGWKPSWQDAAVCSSAVQLVCVSAQGPTSSKSGPSPTKPPASSSTKLVPSKFDLDLLNPADLSPRSIESVDIILQVLCNIDLLNINCSYKVDN